jgi:hypothetical protein
MRHCSKDSQSVSRDVDSSVALRAFHAFTFSSWPCPIALGPARRTLNCVAAPAEGRVGPTDDEAAAGLDGRRRCFERGARYAAQAAAACRACPVVALPAAAWRHMTNGIIAQCAGNGALR